MDIYYEITLLDGNTFVSNNRFDIITLEFPDGYSEDFLRIWPDIYPVYIPFDSLQSIERFIRK